MDSTILQLGVGGIFAIMIIRFFVEMLKVLKSKTSNGDSTTHSGKTETEGKIDALFDWHSKTDHDGVPLWYFPRSFSECQKDIVRSQEKMAEHMREVVRVQSEMSQSLKDISKHVGV